MVKVVERPSRAFPSQLWSQARPGTTVIPVRWKNKEAVHGGAEVTAQASTATMWPLCPSHNVGFRPAAAGPTDMESCPVM